MKLTKKLEADILKVYNAYWRGYLTGDVKGMSSLLTDDYTQVGSAETEVFSNKKTAVRFLHDTIDQVAGKLEMRHRKIRITQQGELVLVNELCDVYVLADAEWVFYARFRASTLMQERKDGWKIVHQHSSFPDARTGEGENIATEKIAAENQQLREAVKRRTIELEEKSRELAIEAALERVRAIALGMKKPADMLEVCRTISLQLQSLGVKEIRNVQTAIFYESRGTYMNYEYYSKHRKTIITEASYTNHRVPRAFARKMLQGKDQIFTTHIKGKKVKDWIAYQKTTNVFIDRFLEKAGSLNYYWHSLGPVALGISTYAPLHQEELSLFKRFLNVFELAYTRYLDIEQAIAQAREARIEAALERVRAVALSMKKPEELPNVCEVLFVELRSLGFNEMRNTMINIHNDEKETFVNYDYSDEIGKSITPLSYSIHPVIEKQIQQIRSARDAFSETVFEGKELREWKAFRRQSGEKDDPRIKNISSLHYYFYSIGTGSIGISTFSSMGVDKLQLLKRFRNVFDFAYRRYMDVAQAEAQAREAQIEAALERVRSRSMAMQKSEELKEVIQVIYEQFIHLNIFVEHTGFIIDYKTRDDMHIWLADQHKVPSQVTIPYFDSPHWNSFNEAKEKGLDFFANHLTFEEKNKFYQELFELFPVPDEAKQYYSNCPGLAISTVLLENVGLYIENFSGIPYTDEENETLMRFGKVFQQTYTRFLDLQKAEAQARESQIEAALERIRARAMAMHTSDELMDVAGILREQMGLLGQPELETSVINLFEENSDQVLSWHAFRSPGLSSGQIITGTASFPSDSNAVSREMMRAYLSGQQEYTMEANGAKAMELIRVLVAAAPEIAEYVGESIPEKVCYHLSYFSGGALLMVSYQPPSEEAKSLQRRAASVFDMAYRRYRDLKKAEAQAKEATIEASLEKVRGKAMAMHTSSDISETMGVVFSELPKLGISSLRCGVALFSKGSRRVIFYAAANALESDSLTLIGTGEMSGHPEFENQYECWLKQENYFVTLSDEALRSYYEALAARLSGPYTRREHHEQTEHGYYFPFSAGNFYAWSEKPYSENEIDILQRFKAIIDLTFRRYLDLKKAEAQTREAQIEASLERVRSRTLAMQKSDELAETAAVLFRQLITLGIEPNRLYIAIMKDESGKAEFWITDEDGSRVSTGFSANLHGNGSFQKMFVGWQDGKKSITIDMQGKELQEYFQHLSSLNVPFKGGLSQTRRIQTVAYFSKGFIGMASLGEQPEETATLLERFAAVFNLTFTRFNDLKLAEAQSHQAHLDLIQLQTEKKRAEDALTELRATQEQLLQQEKLASLGQLTAGIAHEIKNPLNFVNNFSSVSVELVDEAMEEIKKLSGGDGEVQHLLHDVRKNLKKIVEHGTRADGIVKSMLQHSRGGSGKKEPTDLNALVKEYVNLAFHGMRAGKNPINVDIALEFDESVGKISVIAEDFSRVIINLCQNAFDAMRESVNSGEKKSGSYLPRLTVGTRREADKVIIEVGDNGPGIPDAIKDKILQPFFTTKKGTQGTGLGLSITNDIVKAHGGEMNIKTNANGGATFSIALLQQNPNGT